MFWELSDYVHNSLVSNLMRRNRFEEILPVLHVCDNDTINPADRMSKVRPLIDSLSSICISNIIPNENKISIDEAMVWYFGKHGCKQFLKGKLIRF